MSEVDDDKDGAAASSTSLDGLEGEYVGNGSDQEPSGNRRRILVQEAFSGPLPPPALLQKYKEIQQDFPERILSLTESEAKHRRALEMALVEADSRQIAQGQRYGFFVAMTGLVVAFGFAALGHPGYASVLFGGTMLAIVTAFIKGRAMKDNSGQPSEESNEQPDKAQS
ncbi:MAG: DUF2335 domain-containing protein [Pseudomonadota bacterium]